MRLIMWVLRGSNPPHFEAETTRYVLVSPNIRLLPHEERAWAQNIAHEIERELAPFDWWIVGTNYLYEPYPPDGSEETEFTLTWDHDGRYGIYLGNRTLD